MNQRFCSRAALGVAALVALGLSTSGACGGEATPIGAERFRVVYRHAVRNKTSAPLVNVRIYVPIPLSDDSQSVSDLQLMGADRAAQIVDREGECGTPIKQFVLARLAPGEEVAVGYSCAATLRAPPKIALAAARCVSLEGIPPHIAAAFGGDDPRLGLSTPEVRSLASSLLAKHANPVERALAIHDLIASTFEYRRESGWDPAPVSLRRRSGSCSEFTFAFCALCRATGIPTRFVGGSVLSADGGLPFVDRVWHRWAEIYLPGLGWIPFDATADRGRPPKRERAGSYRRRTLVVSRIGGTTSPELGMQYIGANSHGEKIARTREFLWSKPAPGD